MEKFYFESIDETMCYTLDYHIDNAKENGLDKIKLVEAVPEKDPHFVWCTHGGDVVDRSDCRKADCELYEPNKSGRGACIHRGKIYRHGEEVEFNVA